MELINTTNLFKSTCNRFFNTFLKYLKNINMFLGKKFTLAVNTILFSDDSAYRIYFHRSVAPKIYRHHMSTGYKSCVFCNYLKKALYEKHRFVCSKNSHEGCSCLLPGPFKFTEMSNSEEENDILPWVFKTTCTNFNRLSSNNYFKNFTYFDTSVTVSYYEYLEGLYTGICHKKRPCNICASISLEIYRKCFEDGITPKSTPCTEIAKLTIK